MSNQLPGFLHNLDFWLADHVEGVKNGNATAAQIEASPIVQGAVQFADFAAKSYLIAQVAPKLGVEATSAGITGALAGLVDGTSPVIPDAAKEPLKLLLGSLLTGMDFLAPAPTVPAPAPPGRADPELGGHAE